MSELVSLFERINAGPIDKELKLAIADYIIKCLSEKKGSMGIWEKSQFGSSISAFGSNLNQQHQPPYLWLRHCLVSLEKASVPKEQRNEEYVLLDERIEKFTYEILLGAINDLKSRVA